MAHLISGDDHMDLCYVPQDLWQSRVPARFRSAAPRVETQSDGRTMWMREGRRWGVWGSKKADGRKVPFDAVGLAEEPEPGVFRASDPGYRMADMDRDGIHAQVIYNFLDWSFEDPELKSVCCEAFNSWMAEFCSADNDRLVGLSVLPSHAADAAAAELERVTKLGLRGAIFDVFDASLPITDPAWDRLWSFAEESGAAISVHIGLPPGTSALDLGRTWKLPAHAAVACLYLAPVLADVIMSGILERHPGLKFVLGESSIGWIPFVLERLEFEQDNYGKHVGLSDTRPTEQFRRNVYCTFQHEHLDARTLDLVGEDNVMWAADYPHADGTFPNSRAAVDRIFEKLPTSARDKIAGGNAQRLYDIRNPD